MKKSLSVVLIPLLLMGGIGLVSFSAASVVGDLIVDFVEIGRDGVLSSVFPEIRLSVTDSGGQPVSGVKVTVTPSSPHISNVYDWSIIEEASYYRVKIDNFPFFAIKDDFVFTLEKTGFNRKLVSRELAIHAPFIDFIDENGAYRSDSNLQFNMEAIPSHSMIYSQLQTVFVDSNKYHVTTAFQSDYGSEWLNSYLVLDNSYFAVSDSEISNKAIVAYTLGPKFSRAFPTETLDDLANLANQMIDCGNKAFFSKEVRDLAAQFLGKFIAIYLGSVSGQISDSSALAVIQAFKTNFKNIRPAWEAFEIAGNWLQVGVVATKSWLMTQSFENLKFAGHEFLLLKDAISAYRGTPRYHYSEVNNMFEAWFRASSTMLASADFIENILPVQSWFEQGKDILLNGLEGATGIPIETWLLQPLEILKALSNSQIKYGAMRDEFYGKRWQEEDASVSLAQKIASNGHNQIIINVPKANDFQISAYYVSSQMSSATVFAGNSITFTIDARLISGSVGLVSLSLSGQHSTMSTAFVPPLATPPFTSSLTVTTSPATPGSRYTLTITGTAQGLSHSCQVFLEVLNPPSGGAGAITVDPLNSATGTIMYGAYTRYHGKVDPYYNGRTVKLAQSVDGGNLYYLICQYIPTSNNEWYYPSSMTVTEIWLSAWKGVEHPCTYLMKAFIEGTGDTIQSNVVSFTMIKATTSTKISLSTHLLTEGESLTITGTIFSELGIYGPTYACKGNWYVEWRQVNSPDWNIVASGTVYAEFKIPPDGGPYCILFNVPSQTWTPPEAGNFEVRVRYSGDKNYEASTSSETKVIVQRDSYSVTVSVSGLPSDNSTALYVDNTAAGVIAGGSSETLEVSIDTIHVVSIDDIVDYGSDARYVSSTSCAVFVGPGSYDFSFHKECKLTLEVTPSVGGWVSLSGSTWFDLGTAVEATATANPSYYFDHWEVNGIRAGESNSLRLVVDAPTILRASFAALPPYLIVRGADNKVHYSAYNFNGDVWNPWRSISSGVTCDGATATVCCGKLYLVVRGMDGSSLWFGWVNLADNSFSGWKKISGSTPSAPALVSYLSKLVLIVRGLDNRIYHRSYDCVADVWESWMVLPSGRTCDSPAAAVLDDRLHFVVRGFSATSVSTNNSMWRGSLNLDSGSFSGWTKLSGATSSGPTLTASKELGQLYLVVRGMDNRIYYNVLSDSLGGTWIVLPTGTTCDGPGASVADNKLHFVVRGSDGSTLWHRYYDLSTETYSGWKKLSGSTPSPPTLTG